MTALQIFVYGAIMIFLVANFTRFMRIKRTPIHLRWELYPVAHDTKRFKYGGSFLEEADWYTKEIHKSKLGELRVMIPEILLLKGVWEHNRSLWFWTFCFHIGLYLLSGLIGVLILSAIVIGPNIFNGFEDLSSIGKILHQLSNILLIAGSIVGTLGSVGLFFRRMTDREMSVSSSFATYFNIVLIAGIFVSGLVLINSGNGIDKLMTFYYSLIAFKAMPELGRSLAIHVGISGLFMLYLPFTHMAHFFMKYFTYHDVRWNDEPNRRGSKLEKQINEQLTYPVSWAATHLNADGKKNWVDIATSEVTKDDKEN
jgi:nitrate reductase gamma subunit